MSKGKGGLDFRSLYDFSITLLGKLCWHIIENPWSLVTRVFAIRYHPNAEFLQAQLGTGLSFVWTGIIIIKKRIS